MVVLGPEFLGGEDTPDFGHTFANCTHFRACGQFWLISVPGVRRVADDKKEDRRR